MEKFYIRIRNFKLPSKKQINLVFASFSKKEWIVFVGFVVVLLLSTLSILESINKHFMVNVPMPGGSISEGIIGTPRFINPVLANSPADHDLAAKYDMSKNGLIYTFTLKDKIYFHNGKPVTADDVLFTINKVKDSIIKSPSKVNWDGVTVEKLDDKTIRFTLKQPYASFLENTSFGIMPKDIWNNSPLELNEANTNPIGSGPYLIKTVNKKSSGIIDSYELTAFNKFSLGEPYIKNITLYFYANEDELIKMLENGTVDQISSITPLNAENLKERNYQVESAVLPRVFGLFFNQNQNQLFTSKVITRAINQVIDKDKIVYNVLLGYGVAIDDAIP